MTTEQPLFVKGRGSVGKKGASPLSKISSPSLAFEATSITFVAVAGQITILLLDRALGYRLPAPEGIMVVTLT